MRKIKNIAKLFKMHIFKRIADISAESGYSKMFLMQIVLETVKDDGLEELMTEKFWRFIRDVAMEHDF